MGNFNNLSFSNLTLYKFKLNRISLFNSYYDKKSKEPTTKIVGIKYKLCSNLLADLKIFTFLILTTTKESYKKITRIETFPSDWENVQIRKGKTRYHDRICYISIEHFEILNENDLMEKIKDIQNGFLYTGKLKKQKIKDLYKTYHTTRHTLPPKYNIENILSPINLEELS